MSRGSVETYPVPGAAGGIVNVEVDVGAATAACRIGGVDVLTVARGGPVRCHSQNLVHLAAACTALLRARNALLSGPTAGGFKWLRDFFPEYEDLNVQ